MAKLELTNEQLLIIQNALDLYSRIGILQLDEILQHPSIERMIEKQFSPNTPLKVGDQTMRGEIVKITKKSISTKGRWASSEEIREWFDIENIYHSADYSKVHDTEDEIRNNIKVIKKLISGQDFGHSGSYGIHNKIVDESCRAAYDIVQVIRNEFWKKQDDRNECVVSSSVSLSSNLEIVKVELDK